MLLLMEVCQGRIVPTYPMIVRGHSTILGPPVMVSACSNILIYLDCYEAVTEREGHSEQYRLRRL